MNKIIKVLLVDDHALVRKSLQQILLNTKDIQVINEASTGEEAVQQIHISKPDIVILDLQLPDFSGLDVTKTISNLNDQIKIIIVSSITHDYSLFRLLEAGAHGYLPKTTTPEELVYTIRAVHSGQKVISPQLAKRLALTKTFFSSENIFGQLSEREKEVMQEVIRGLPVAEIAEKLKIDHKTVHSYRNRIFEKLNVKGSLALTLFALHHGMITFNTLEE